jgi:hypothetical protein
MPDRICPVLFSRSLFNALSAGALCVVLGGCGLGDSDLADCRCGPETSSLLFPHCANTAAEEARDPANPFATSVPECPSGQQLFLLERTRPEYVLTNLRTIFTAPPESRNPEQYMEQLTEDFSFVPDEEDLQRHPEIYDTARDTVWGAAQERDFARAILDPERTQSARFIRWFQSSIDERIPSADQLSETFIFPYEIEFTETASEDGASAGNVIAIKGYIEIDLTTPTAENPVWNIAQWRDLRDRASAKFSWGELRALFAR